MSEVELPLADAATVGRLLDRRPGDVILLARGRYSPRPAEGARVHVLQVDGTRLRELEDLWLSPEDLDALHRERGTLLRGSTDAMFATRWRYAWSKQPGFRLWSRRELILEARDGSVRLRGAALDGDPPTGVRAWLGPDWIRREVRLVCASGRVEPVAKQTDRFVSIDPTYDWINLQADAAWCCDLARDLGEALGVPVEVAPELE